MPKGIKGFQKGHIQFNSGKTHFKKGNTNRLGVKGNKHPCWSGGRSVSCRRWLESHRDVARLVTIRRRARIKGVGGSFTIGEWTNLKIQYNYTCPCCRRCEPDIKLTVDHIIPISKGGSNNIENIQPLCMPCNRKKYTKIDKFDY